MRTQIVFPCALVLAVLGLSTLGAQELPSKPTLLAPPAPDAVPPGNGEPLHGQPAWITYTQPDCCGSVGGNGPIKLELFAQSGVSIPIGGGIFSSVLDTGWTIEAGGRSLFFNNAGDSDWALSLSLANTYNHAHSAGAIPFPSGVPPTEHAVTIGSLNRTYAVADIGKDWVLDRPFGWFGNHQLQLGMDIFGRYGTEKVTFHELLHVTDVTAGLGAGFHGDMEIPWGCRLFLVGLRTEWAYNWMDALKRESNLIDLNFVVTFGLRF
jgi:hypothetical protein